MCIIVFMEYNDNNFDFSRIKSAQLRHERGIGFEEVIQWIKKEKIVDVIPHPNPEKYPNQHIFVIAYDDYIYSVPFVKNGDEFFLKTLYRSRKLTKQYFGRMS